jgi:hypothetical protein
MLMSVVFGMIVALFQSAPPADVWLISPDGERSAITRNTTETDLVRIHGRENVADGDVNVGEGELEPGTILYPNDPARTLQIIWKDAKTRTAPKRIQLTGDASKWKTVSNVTLGTSLKELERINGRPFRLLGFGWDYSGTVTSWSAGELSRCCQPQAGLYIRLIPADLDGELYSTVGGQVRGDREYSSGHPAMQSLNPRVYQIVIDFL